MQTFHAIEVYFNGLKQHPKGNFNAKKHQNTIVLINIICTEKALAQLVALVQKVMHVGIQLYR